MKELCSYDNPWQRGLGAQGVSFDDTVENPDLSHLAFVMEPPQVRDGALCFRLWIENDTDTVTTLAVDGFGLQPTHLRSVPYVGPTMMAPAPPVPVRFTIPKRARVALSRTFALAHYDFAGIRFDYAWSLQDHRRQSVAHGVVTGIQVDPARGVVTA